MNAGGTSNGGAAGSGGPGLGGQGGSGGASPVGGGAGGSGGVPVGGAAGAAAQELIHYYGRWNRLADRAITVNSGSHVGAQFTGTAITALFDISLNIGSAMPTLAWQIDQGAWQEADMAARVTLGANLSAGMHSVTLMARALDENQSRWSPPLTSSITFLGFDVTGGALEPSARPARPKLEIVGDSITEGVVVWTSRNGKTTQCWRNDARVAYPTQTAQLLRAEWRQVGFGYHGLLRGGNGGVPKANDSFNWIYKDVPRDSWQADMVVINEGTNDAQQSASSFRSAYRTYLQTIRTAYPNAKIVALRPFNGAQAQQIQAEVESANTAGDARVYYVDSTGWLGSGDYTDSVHPNEQGSRKAAEALSAAIMRIGLP
jgi:lysophospholipase L1-like esterase